jgi:hypothetical protein
LSKRRQEREFTGEYVKVEKACRFEDECIHPEFLCNINRSLKNGKKEKKASYNNYHHGWNTPHLALTHTHKHI